MAVQTVFEAAVEGVDLADVRSAVATGTSWSKHHERFAGVGRSGATSCVRTSGFLPTGGATRLFGSAGAWVHQFVNL